MSETIGQIARKFVAAYSGNKAGVLGNGAARRALDEFRAALASDPLPPGAVIHASVRVIGYFTTDGDLKYAVLYRGEDVPTSTYVGLLEMAKMDAITQNMFPDNEDDDS